MAMDASSRVVFPRSSQSRQRRPRYRTRRLARSATPRRARAQSWCPSRRSGWCRSCCSSRCRGRPPRCRRRRPAGGAKRSAARRWHPSRWSWRSGSRRSCCSYRRRGRPPRCRTRQPGRPATGSPAGRGVGRGPRRLARRRGPANPAEQRGVPQEEGGASTSFLRTAGRHRFGVVRRLQRPRPPLVTLRGQVTAESVKSPPRVRADGPEGCIPPTVPAEVRGSVGRALRCERRRPDAGLAGARPTSSAAALGNGRQTAGTSVDGRPRRAVARPPRRRAPARSAEAPGCGIEGPAEYASALTQNGHVAASA